MRTLLGPHMLEAPNNFLDTLKSWRPPVCLLLVNVRQMPYNPTGLDLKNRDQLNNIDLDQLATMVQGPLIPYIDTLIPYIDNEILQQVQPFQDHVELRDTKLILRLFLDEGAVAAHIVENPEKTAQFHHNLVQAARTKLAKLADRVDYWVIANELLGDIQKLNVPSYSLALEKLGHYEKERMRLAGADYGCGLYAFANGHPLLQGKPFGGDQAYDETGTDPLHHWKANSDFGLRTVLTEANRINGSQTSPSHVLLLHQYFKPDNRLESQGLWLAETDLTDPNKEKLTDLNKEKNVRRFEHHVYDWFKRAYPSLKVIVSEYGADGRIGRTGNALELSLGWKHYEAWIGDTEDDNDGAPYMRTLKALEKENQRCQDVILGYCLFGLGYNSPEFWSYRLDPYKDSEGPADQQWQQAATVVKTLLHHVEHSTIGRYANQAEHHNGIYALSKGDTLNRVDGVFCTDRSPVLHYAKLPAEKDKDRILFEIPSGFRPSEDKTVAVEQAWTVDSDGTDVVPATAHKFEMEVQSNGSVRYVNNDKVSDLESSDVGYLKYYVDVSWPSSSAPSSALLAQPRLHIGTIDDDLPLRTGPSAIYPKIRKLPSSRSTWYLILGRYQNSPVWWQIRVNESTTGWVNGHFVVTAGDLSGVPAVPVEWPTPPRPEQPPPPPNGVQRASGPYLNQATNWEGTWAVSKHGTTVTANFGSARSPVQYYARQQPEDLFVLPAGFRPTALVQCTVSDGRHKNADGTDHVSGIPARFDLTVHPDGAVRYVDNHLVDHVGYLAYRITDLQWQTPAALALPLASPTLPDLERQGHFQNRAVHWSGHYDLTRRGDTVTGTFGSARSAVQYAARQRAADLCVLPADIRPARRYQHTVSDARHVNADGTDHVSGIPARFDLTVHPDGAVRYVDGSELDHVGYLRYTAQVRWTAAPRVQAPAAPEDLHVEDLEATAATLDWSRPDHDGGARVTGYRIERWTGSVWRALVPDTGSTRTRHTLTGLTAATVYLLRVRALNAAGAGTPSGAVQAMTAAAPLLRPGRVAGLTATAAGDQVQLRWQAPTTGGPVEGYRVWRRTGPAGTWILHVPDTGETVTQWRDQRGLTPATVYGYAVQAYHATATGDRSAPVTVTTAGPPAAVGAGTVRLAGGQVTLTWEVPATDGGRPILHYRVRRRLASRNQAYIVYAAQAPDTTYTETAPTVDGTWYYSVQAVNALGAGPWSNPETSGHVLQVGTTPAAVGAGTVCLAGGQVTLTWEVPATDGGRPILHYRVRRRLASRNQAYIVYAAQAPDTTYAETAPTVDGTWYYSVQAVNALGAGPWSNPETSGHVLQVGTTPAAVGAGTVRLAGGQVTLTWEVPATDGGRPILHYRVRRRLASRNQAYIVYAAQAPDTTYAETAPTVDGTWYYSVQAVNALGAGPWSNPETHGHILILPA